MADPTEEEVELVGRLIERLLVDPEFRAEFRRDPSGACVVAGLPGLAGELGGSGKAMHTMELRESRSSLAGVVMAIAAEGIALEQVERLAAHGLPGGLGKALHGVKVPKEAHGLGKASPSGLEHKLEHKAGVSPAALKRVEAAGGSSGAAGGAAGSSAAGSSGGAGGSSGAAGGAAGSSAAGSSAAGGAGGSAAGAAGGAGGSAAGSAGSAGGSQAASHAAAGSSGGGGSASGAGHGSAGGSAGASKVAGSPNMGGGTATASSSSSSGSGSGSGSGGGWPDQSSPSGGAAAASSAPAGTGAAAASSTPTGGAAASTVPAGAGVSTVPAGAGASTVPAGAGSGGAVPGAVEGASNAAGGTGVAPAGLAGLLDSPGFTAPPTVRTWLESGGVDPRVVSMLDSILAHHTIGVSNLEVLSTPVHVQSFDIVSVDGQPVGPDNFAARDLVTEIAAMDPNIRPDEIGTPWPIQSPGFFTGPSSTNGLHFAFEAPGTNATPAQEAGYTGIDSGQPQPQMNYAIGAQPTAGAAAPLYPGTGPSAVQQLSPAAVATGTPGAGVVGSVLAAGPSVGSSPHTGPQAVLDYARSMIGKLPESSGPNMGPALNKFEAQYGFHGAPWCGIFAGHALQAAGLKVPHSVASVASILDLARNGDPPFVKGILPISAARPGDLATFGGAEHVAIITKIDAAGVHTIAGNTSQSNVSETIYSPGSVTGVVRPDYALAPGGGAGAGAAAAAADPSAGAAPVPGAAPAAAGAPGAASATAAPGAPAAAVPGAPAGAVPGAAAGAIPGTPAEAVPVAGTPGTAAFKAIPPHEHGPPRHTVQFLQAVQPSTGAPASDQAAAAAPGGQVPAVPGAAPGAVPEPTVPAAPGGGGVAGAAEQVVGQSPGVPVSGAITVSSSLLTSGQETFAGHLAQLTGLSPRVIAAWELAEESGGPAQARQAASNFNWLNIGYFDSGAGQMAFNHAFSDPVTAAEQTAKFLKGDWGGASSSIRAILSTVGQGPEQQMSAIANSDWASSHYYGGSSLRGTFSELADMKVESAPNSA